MPIQTEGVCAPCDSGAKCSFKYILDIYYNILIIIFYMYNSNMGKNIYIYFVEKKYYILLLQFTFQSYIQYFYEHQIMGKKQTNSLLQFDIIITV